MNESDYPTMEPTPVKLPIPPAKKVSVSSEVGCAIVEESVVCWGYNINEQVARWDGQNRGAWLPPNPVALPPGKKPRAISVGNASLVILEDGSTVSWGATPPAGRATSRFPDGVPQPIAIAGITTSIHVDIDNACAAAGGIAYCWGAARPIGQVVNLSRALPAPVPAPEPLRQVSTMRRYDAPNRWCAVGVSGAVYCWGYNASGQAGDGTKDHAYDAVKVMGLPAPAVEVKVALDATCALLTNGKVHCWGSNYYGQLGTGQFRVASVTPQEVLLP